ncbi:hypothetical protein LEP1GSC161_0275 [Leptospira santarosai str. CBC1416]|uniref:Uncharacterized protein n=1 Tax=Leptospira santarosai str. CBC1416 TaxID=1193059 RepID=M6VX55_9LEPT|nr:hypothetical protein LEP1GSC161_0275 [Leptospira santarosai str. CBC1416]
MSLTDEQLKKTIPEIIRRRRESVSKEEIEKQMLVEYIRYFVNLKRGNAALLVKETKFPSGNLSRLISGEGAQPSFDRILFISETVQKLLKKQI